MYNIHSHYENIFQSLSSIVTYRRLLYLLPYGSTQPENAEAVTDDIANFGGWVDEGPLFVFYDQEPIYGEYNYRFLDYVKTLQPPYVLVTTEKESDPLDQIKEDYGFPTAYYFHHAFAANDWFRGYRYNSQMVPVRKRKLKKKYITFNRLTSGQRVYRTLLINELVSRDLLHHGYVSYNDICPDGGTYQENLEIAVKKKQITGQHAVQVMQNISSIPLPLRIDYQDQQFIPNHSFTLSAIPETQESFCYLVTETCYWERKHHLTEKIFKPIVSRMPFVLAGPAHNLKYLREYGFKTFGQWFDESYDDIEDPLARMKAIGYTMNEICSLSLEQLTAMLHDMEETLEHNHNLFHSNQFLDNCWRELQTNLAVAASSIRKPQH